MNREAVWHVFGKDLHNMGFFETGTSKSMNGACTCTKLNDGVIPKSIDIDLKKT